MSEITAVPLRPIAKGSLVKLWLGVAIAALAGAGLAYAGTQGVIGKSSAGFLAKNADEDGVVTTTSGLQYKVLEAGQGERPTTDDVALINYTGMLTDGKIFDQNQRAPLPIDGVVPGFSEGLQLMQRGGKYRLWIPPELGYGSNVPEGGPIPKDSVLVFDVELLDYVSKAQLMQMQQQMQQGHAPAGQ
ncbi:FKBP-type peptidyl-prolyl cis-trans isomerase [Rhizorhapis suberifaciens]|uniref:Peptidyl-prolyl cis-trans isomerase n=1 Tax=Rhizorhapis suberifaciens TaxID=13656 RepID=A0A840HRH9_9SPHN|nr:FKBP-type peptidyl-prolyl cis-trans isomerase [Rhizorhapis suberifaciens]MBB4640483.1 FKBP-type peptidyl-prolyl cis-trans isomerase [Rhizorhapis suberifaciens]